MPFLDKTGLAHFWNQIIARLSKYETTENAQLKLEEAKSYTDNSIPTKVTDLENDAEYITADALSGLGGGDMLKATYDKDGDGVVDDSEKLGGVEASKYAKKTDIPTAVSAFTNDKGYLTSYTETDPVFKASAAAGIKAGDITNWNNKSNFDGNYNSLTNKPTIPPAITVDSTLSSSSTNPVQNKVINSALAGKAPSGYGFGESTNVAVSDINNLTKTGFYQFVTDAFDGSATNYYLIHQIHTDSYACQIAIQVVNPNIIYQRIKRGGTWEGWTQYITPANIGSQSVYYANFAGGADTAISATSANSVAFQNITAAPTTTTAGSYPVSITQSFKIGDITFPQYAKGMFIYPTGGDATLTVVDTSGHIYTAYRNGTTWQGPRIMIDSGNIGSQSVNYAASAGGVAWGNVSGKPSTFTPASHTQAASTITGLATVATSGKYSDLSGKPTIPAAPNNGTLTIQKNGTTVATFGANQSTAATANITVPTGAAADKGVDTSISTGSTSTNLPTSKAVAAFVEGKGYKTTDNNTTYTFATGDSNGQIKITPSGGTAQNVSVKGLGSAAYTASTAYAPASHTQAASTITGLATVATSGNYGDLIGRPTIPAAANNGTLTIQKNGSTVATFGANQSGNATANITVPTKTSDLTNDSGFKNIGYGTTLPSTGVNGQIFLLQG